MRLPDFLSFTPEERRAVLAILLFTGGGGVLIELARRYPAWTPGLRAAPAVTVDSTRADTSASPPAPIAAALVAGDPAAPPPPIAPPASMNAREPLGSPKPAGPIDLNRAGARELESLPGVGPKLAERIVLDRSEKGPFRRVADLDRVKGVGPALLQKLAPLVVVSPASSKASTGSPSPGRPPRPKSPGG